MVVTPWDYCSHASSIGHLLRLLRKGTELPDTIVTRIVNLRELLAASPDANVPEIGDLDAALGKLALAVQAAGANYPFSATVELRAKTVSYTALTASLTLCT